MWGASDEPIVTSLDWDILQKFESKHSRNHIARPFNDQRDEMIRRSDNSMLDNPVYSVKDQILKS